MPTRIDEHRQMVCVGDAQWPFLLNLSEGTALLRAGTQSWCVRPLRWIEKVRLARLAHLGEDFAGKQLWTMCVQPESQEASAEEREGLLALSAWLSAGGVADTALPLDPAILVRVTADTCRQLGIPPGALDAMPACEVESLWRYGSEASPETQPDKSPEFTHKIVIVPDKAIPMAQVLSSADSENTVIGEIEKDITLSAETFDFGPAATVTPEQPALSTPPAREPSMTRIAASDGSDAANEEEPSTPASDLKGISAPSIPARDTTSRVNTPHAETSVPDANLPLNAGPVRSRANTRPRTTLLSRFRVVMGPVASLPESSSGAANHPNLFSEPAGSQGMAGMDRPTPTVAQGERHTEPEWIEQLFSAPSNGAVEWAPGFEEFAAEFGDRLRLAAEELGIIEGR